MDFGTHTTDSCDYPIPLPLPHGQSPTANVKRGIVLCTTGIGASIAAAKNKVKGVRCALLSDVLSARMTRLHDDTM